jgi:hypothetical protein
VEREENVSFERVKITPVRYPSRDAMEGTGYMRLESVSGAEIMHLVFVSD